MSLFDLPLAVAEWIERDGSRWAASRDIKADQPLYQFPANRPKRTALVTLLGTEQAGVNAFLALPPPRLRGFEGLVFVTTAADISGFWLRRLIVEQLPTPPRDESRNWGHYLNRRVEIIMSKWEPQWMLHYGETLSEYLDRWVRP